METLMIIVSGVLVTVATYLLLTKNLMRIILGAAVLTHAVHLLIMAMGGFSGNAVPIIRRPGETYVDALPQALILTSIVINFAVTAFFLVLAYKVYNRTKTDDLNNMRGIHHE
ncbi:MAG TPA: Na(+)/H(+) antiporter subunit C [Pseudogracilibacillus sp.]|nr:Na(+)/H(+) antiporter subunit C [Pseudogracilibacillus sp.]